MPGAYRQQRNLKQLFPIFFLFIFLNNDRTKKEVIYAMTCQAGLPDWYDVYLNQKIKPNHLRITHACVTE